MWGIVSFIVVIGLSTTFRLINGNRLHTFLFFIYRHIGVYGFERLLTQNRYTMYTKFYLPYLAPDVEVVAIAVEHGFANSIEDPVENPEQEW